MFIIGAPHLRDIFYRMGLTDKDIVALSGGHTLVVLLLAAVLRQYFNTILIWLKLWLCFWWHREGHIQRDQGLMAHGPMNRSSLITPILCKRLFCKYFSRLSSWMFIGFICTCTKTLMSFDSSHQGVVERRIWGTVATSYW